MTHDPDLQLPDGTLRFLPTRLNRQPVIVLGLTADEMWVTVGCGGLAGLGLGIAAAVLFQSIALAPTMMMLCVGLGLFIGGKLLRRHKRGKPETWLYRQLQWIIATRWTLLTAWAGGADLVIRSGRWSTRRSHRR
ncbi:MULTISPECIES: TIGR03750 family conjugal transfer protein [Pseudomonas]|uniref:TIGR03750 family conjugal transfer protein n=1 Tax=Pseudomonas TaxID=286 RepID=UPI000CFE1586|nr:MULTISPECIES: TIGR03750 family conjugal transfer protein [Pseudomonas]PQZ91017.1 TIGR03750 family conjugal transfer protein [Pseudomonas trivialis]PRB26249.1 TIGR03750 family conjugal transfer protein [Pseudomonas sp. MYb60]